MSGIVPSAYANISTHALTWSATGCAPTRKSEHRNFNSRTHVECDMTAPYVPISLPDFNSRTHVECDR